MKKYCFDNSQIKNFINDFEEVYGRFLGFGGLVFDDENQLVRLKKCFYACALCHNMNWEYLCNKVISPYFDATNFEPKLLRDNGVKVFAKCFDGYEKKHKIEADVRFSMLCTLADYVADNPDVFNKILGCQKLDGADGLNETINTLPVFMDDPLHKKGNLLVQILLREGFVSVEDEENVEPAVDYHVIRSYLRFPFVNVMDDNITDRLITGGDFSLAEITELRTSISDAMKYISKKSGVSVAKLCFLAWSIGRDYCHKEGASCVESDECPVCHICKGKMEESIRLLKEPVSNHGFY